MDQERKAFLQSLTDDVRWALSHMQEEDTPIARRNLLRTLISATEGMSWVYRVHVLSIAKEFDATTPLLEMAFAEASFMVTEQGKIVEQARYISLPAMIRLTTRVASTFCEDARIDFECAEWDNLKKAITARNRITHPKNYDDLLLSDAEIEAAKSGFFWIFDMSIGVMELTVKALGRHAEITKDVVGKLVSGDPDTLALYDRAHRGGDG